MLCGLETGHGRKGGVEGARAGGDCEPSAERLRDPQGLSNGSGFKGKRRVTKVGALSPSGLYSLLFPRSETCEDGKLGLKYEEDGGEG